MRGIVFIFCLLLSTLTAALSLKNDAPIQYTVKQDDTLWSIANRYLKNPWEWKALWRANPKIKNPKRLYPGAVIVLYKDKKHPYLKVLTNGTVRLSPGLRSTPANSAVPLISLRDIKPFLNESLILDEDVLNRAPYVLALMGDRMLGGQGDQVYVRGLHPSPTLPEGATVAYSIFRPGTTYLDPLSKTLLGYEAKLVGYGELVAGGEPAIMLLTQINEGIQKLDRVLINNSPEFNLYFEPSTPENTVSGIIMKMPTTMPSGEEQGATGNVIVINVGANKGLKSGNVLGIYGKQRVVPDPKNHLIPIKLPAERIGDALVFRAFSQTSFALIVRSTRAIYLLDTVANP